MSLMAWSRSITAISRADQLSQRVFVLGFVACFFLGDEPLLINSVRHWSSVCIPLAWPVWMAEYIWAILAFADQVSDGRRADHDLVRRHAAPPVFFNRVWEMTARSDSDSIERTMSFSAAGKTGHSCWLRCIRARPRRPSTYRGRVPAAEKDMVRSMLSESLRAVISQTLLKKTGGGRVAAHEIMIARRPSET